MRRLMRTILLTILFTTGVFSLSPGQAAAFFRHAKVDPASVVNGQTVLVRFTGSGWSQNIRWSNGQTGVRICWMTCDEKAAGFKTILGYAHVASDGTFSYSTEVFGYEVGEYDILFDDDSILGPVTRRFTITGQPNTLTVKGYAICVAPDLNLVFCNKVSLEAGGKVQEYFPQTFSARKFLFHNVPKNVKATLTIEDEFGACHYTFTTSSSGDINPWDDVMDLDWQGKPGPCFRFFNDAVDGVKSVYEYMFTKLWKAIDQAVKEGKATSPLARVVQANDPSSVTSSRATALSEASKTWIFGPEPFTSVLMEEYEEGSANGADANYRAVQYYDKTRMEVTDIDTDPNATWYVTNGLLVQELVTGNIQLGDNVFEQHSPAKVNVAGDADDMAGPTYETFGLLLNRPATVDDATLIERIDRQGNITSDPSLADYGVTAAYRVSVPGIDHQVASPFWEFMNSSRSIYRDGTYVEDRLFANPFYAVGLPIADAYWARVKVAGIHQDVLMQCFERRCLTYTPGNPDGWKVEAGNVGRHYYMWRYGSMS